MPTCEKCKIEFPNWVEIDGKKRNLQNRLFCLFCSPFKKHNTTDLTKYEGDLTKCEVDSKKCTKCERFFPLNLFYTKGKSVGSWCKKCLNENSARIWQEQKKKLVDYKGGKCQKCGYNKCIDALELHHRNPMEKDSTIKFSRKMIWDKVKSEADKCDLLCANCHREAHCEMNKLKKSYGKSFDLEA